MTAGHDPWQLTPEQRSELLESLSDDYIFGYKLGVHASWSQAWTAGWDACEADMTSSWAKVAKEVRDGARHPSAVELQARRTTDHQPCPQKCDACSTCLHSRAWYARGGRPFLGMAAEAELARAAS